MQSIIIAISELQQTYLEKKYQKFLRTYLRQCQLEFSGTETALSTAFKKCASISDVRRASQLYRGPIAYLAQHSLFDQFTELKKDFQPPAFASSVAGGVQRVNAWLGTAATVTPLHFDSYNNFFVQVVGCKIVRLYMPDQTERLYVNRGDESPSARVYIM